MSYHANWMTKRRVSWPMQLYIFFSSGLQQLGWTFFGFGMIFVWVFGYFADFGPLVFGLSSVRTAPGTVTAVYATSASQNEVRVYANQFTFRVERLETEFRGESYTSGSRYRVGQEVTVEYLERDPAWSRIEGTRSGEFSSPVMCFVFIFPLIGLLIVIAGLWRGWQGLRLIKEGRLTTGRLINKEATGSRVNKQTVFKLTFEFSAMDGSVHQVSARSHKPAPLEDEEQEQILYEPGNPNRAIVVDEMPGDPDIDEFGNVSLGSAVRGISFVLPLLLPLIMLGINGGILLWLLLG